MANVAMTSKEYKAAREKLGLSNYALAPVLGVSLRQAQRYEAGQSPIPLPVAKLLRLILSTDTNPRTV